MSSKKESSASTDVMLANMLAELKLIKDEIGAVKADNKALQASFESYKAEKRSRNKTVVAVDPAAATDALSQATSASVKKDDEKVLVEYLEVILRDLAANPNKHDNTVIGQLIIRTPPAKKNVEGFKTQVAKKEGTAEEKAKFIHTTAVALKRSIGKERAKFVDEYTKMYGGKDSEKESKKKADGESTTTAGAAGGAKTDAKKTTGASPAKASTSKDAKKTVVLAAKEPEPEDE